MIPPPQRLSVTVEEGGYIEESGPEPAEDLVEE
jgi:hypothetical protein